MAEHVTDTSERKLEDAAAAKLKKEAEAKSKAAGSSEKSETHKKAEK
ncbi:MAG TPA: hypothetical protein VKL21_02620 [Candidatus Methanoperedens sp.]|nr:hypothetical protein [Candidatus Methanoperedens sp.]